MTNDKTVYEAIVAANGAPYTPARASGCGRAYVVICTGDKAILKSVAAACEKLGLLFSRKGHYGTGGNSIYIGYDNCDGRALGKSQAFAQVLNDHGIKAYSDAVSD